MPPLRGRLARRQAAPPGGIPHRGAARRVAWPRQKISISREQAYQRLVESKGLFAEGSIAGSRAGQSYRLRAVTGEEFSGRVEFNIPPRGFCVTVEQMNDALLWLTIEGAPGKHEAQLWLSAFGVPQTQVEQFGERWQQVLKTLFA